VHRRLLAAVAATGLSLALTTLGHPTPAAGAPTTVLASTVIGADTLTAIGHPGPPPVVEGRLETGAVSVTLPDPVTGAPVGAFCVELVDEVVVRSGCTGTGTLLLADVPAGDYLVLAYRAGQDAVSGVARQAVVAGEVAAVVTE
jgi:hypothetical protein